MTECEKYEEMISAHIDGELTQPEERELQAHLRQCPECRRMLKALTEVSKAAGTLPEIPAELHEGIMSAVRKASGDEKPKKARGRLRWLRPTAIAAACCVVIAAALLAGDGLHWRMDSAENSSSAAMERAPADADMSYSSGADTSGSGSSGYEYDGSETVLGDGESQTVATAPAGEDGDNGAAAPEEKEEAAEAVLFELDISSARLVTRSDAGETGTELSGYDAMLWLASLVSDSVDFADAVAKDGVSYELDFETSEADAETVYFFYDHGALYASRESDRSGSWPIDSAQTLKDFIEY